MPLYHYTCTSCGKSLEALRPINQRNELPRCSCGSVMERAGIELQKRPRVQGGTSIKYRN